MSEVGLPQVTEMPFINVCGWFWADCAAGVRRPCTRSCAVCELIVRKRGALLSSYPRALVGYLCHLVCWGLWSSALSLLSAAGFSGRLQLGSSSSSQGQQPCAVGYLPCRSDDTTPSCCHISVGVCCRRVARGPGPQLTAPCGAASSKRAQPPEAQRNDEPTTPSCCHRSTGTVGGFCR